MAVTTSTDLPAWLLSRLEAHGIKRYQIQCDTQELPPNHRVQMTWMEDAMGSLLVLYSKNYLLDLSSILNLTGRPFEPISRERQQHFTTQYGLGPLSGLFLQDKSHCLCETRLLDQSRLLFDFGQTGWLLELSAEVFIPLLAGRRTERFGIALSGIQPEANQPLSFTSQRIYQRLDALVEIPPLPHTAHRLAQLRDNPRASVDDLTGLVETDPPLAAQVVSWASSSFHAYAAPEKIRSVRDAIARALGFERVINLALGLAMGQTLRIPDQRSMATSYWHQAIYVAMVVDGLVHAMPARRRPEPGLAYLVGLLHNFGTLILAHVFPPHFSTLCQHQEANPHVPSPVIEHYLLGITREQISAWLMQRWQMPEELITAMYYQLDPHYKGAYSVYPNLAYVAMQVLGQHGVGRSVPSEIPAALLARLGLDFSQAEGAVEMVLDAEAELRELAQKIQSVNSHQHQPGLGS